MDVNTQYCVFITFTFYFMKALLFIVSLFFATNVVTTFDNSNYINDAAALEFIDSHFVKDIQSSELTNALEAYLVKHLDEIDHISGHYSNENSSHYYAVYGSFNGAKTFKMLEVDQKLFDNNSYYNTDKSAEHGHCLKGFDIFSRVLCYGDWCEVRGYQCLGMLCPPLECF